MRVLVTGGAGYIGSHVCKALAIAGWQPIVYDSLSGGEASAVKWGPLEIGDTSDGRRVREVLDAYRPRAVMHLAASTQVNGPVEDPLFYYRNNIGGMQSLLEMVVDAGAVPVVFSSSSSIYGPSAAIPIAEHHPQQPQNPYGVSKLVGERMLLDLDEARGLRSVALRYFNVAGADPDGDIGDQRSQQTHLIARVLSAARDGTPMWVYGDDYETADGTCVRDFVHVSDVADAHVRALDYLLRDGPTCALNLASSRGHSVKEVIATVERVSSRPVAVEIAPRRAGDTAVLLGDASAARQLLGWAPQRSDLEAIVRDAWRAQAGRG